MKKDSMGVIYYDKYICRFTWSSVLSFGDGSGDGNGSGDGWGDGYGNGNGDGFGRGNGDGFDK